MLKYLYSYLLGFTDGRGNIVNGVAAEVGDGSLENPAGMNTSILTYIFVTVLHLKYTKIAPEFKEEFFKRVQESIIVYIKKYGLYKDIRNNVDEEILHFFEFDDIVNELYSQLP